jgi:hypothetical protein
MTYVCQIGVPAEQPITTIHMTVNCYPVGWHHDNIFEESDS